MEPALLVGLLLAVGIGGYFLMVNAAGGNPLSPNTNPGANILTPSQIAAYAANAGFADGDLVVAVAIALAETSPPGNANSHGDLTLGTGTGSFGLWQIYSDAHPEYGPDFTQLYDPQTNANAAFAIYQAAGNSFSPWSTYTSAKYQGFLSDAEAGANV